MAALVGLAQGLLITRLNLQPFIVTLGGMLLLRGVSQTIVRGGTLSLGDVPLARFANGGLLRVRGQPAPALPVPRSSWSWPLVAAYLLHFTVFGRYVYAIGGNRDAAEYSGIPVRRVETLTYVISAFSGGVAGVCYAAYIGQMSQQVGIAYELYAIAAAVLGGVSLRGGEGTVLGSIIGSCIMRVIDNGINMFQWVYRDANGVAAHLPPGQQLDLHHHRRRDPGGRGPRPGRPHRPVEAPDAARRRPGGGPPPAPREHRGTVKVALVGAGAGGASTRASSPRRGRRLRRVCGRTPEKTARPGGRVRRARLHRHRRGCWTPSAPTWSGSAWVTRSTSPPPSR